MSLRELKNDMRIRVNIDRICKRCKAIYKTCKNDIGLCDRCVHIVFRETIHKEIRKMGFPR